MKILVINAGSSSLKFQLINMSDESVVLKGHCERITFAGSHLSQKTFDGREIVIKQDMPTHKEAMELVLKAMLDPEKGALKNVSEISAVGHRVLHSGEDFKHSVVIDDEVIKICEKNAELGPLHMPGNIACIKSCMEVMKGVPMVAVSIRLSTARCPQRRICTVSRTKFTNSIKSENTVSTVLRINSFPKKLASF